MSAPDHCGRVRPMTGCRVLGPPLHEDRITPCACWCAACCASVAAEPVRDYRRRLDAARARLLALLAAR